jgi:hypothetical protein
MEIDKQTAARRLIHSAIRHTCYGGDPLATHIMVWSAYEVIQDCANHAKVTLKSDTLRQVSELAGDDKLRREVWRGLRGIHNFVRHADNDPDGKIDVAKVEPFTEALIVITAQMYEELFGETTKHMEVYEIFARLNVPALPDPKIKAEMQSDPVWLGLKNATHAQRLEMMRSFLDEQPELLSEVEH